MMPGRAMSLVLRDPFRAWGGTSQAVKMSQLWDHPLAWAPSQVPPCLRTIPRSWGPFQAPPWLGPSWELRDHPGLLEIFPGFSSLETIQGSWGGIILVCGDHLGCFPSWGQFWSLGNHPGLVSGIIPGSWTPSWGLEDHPDFWGSSGVLLFLGTILEPLEVSWGLQDALGDHPCPWGPPKVLHCLGTVLESGHGNHTEFLPALVPAQDLRDSQISGNMDHPRCLHPGISGTVLGSWGQPLHLWEHPKCLPV